MKEYDSVLNNNKKYEEPIINNNYKKFPWFKIDILLISILLIIGYFIYYNTILSSKLIFINDIKVLMGKYDDILTPLEINKLSNNYGLIGNIKLNDKDYNFEIDKINKEINFILGVDNQSLHYYSNNNENYIKLSNNDTFYKKNNNDYLNMLSNLKDYFVNLSKDKFIKKFYFNGTIPIVESNIVLNNDDLIKALKPNHYDSTYQVLFTFKNNAITNEVISMKVIVNNLMTNKRKVFIYENGYLTYTNEEEKIKLELENKDKDFTLKISKSDILCSTLIGTKKEDSYLYSYQVIDREYNVNASISKIEDNYYLDIKSIIDNNENNLNINFQYLDPIIDNDINNSIDYSSLTKEEKNIYINNLNIIIEFLGEFINNLI